jgi:site-specific recombinase XerD
VESLGTLGSYVAEYVRQRKARGELTLKTANDTRSGLHGLAVSFGNRPLTRFGEAAIDTWLETQGHCAPSTRRRRLSQVRCFCQWMVRKKHIKRDPTEHVPAIRQPRSVPVTLPQDDVSLVLCVCPDKRARCMVHLMVYCGLRCVEVSRLMMADYDPRGRTLRVQGKGGHQRIVPVPDAAAASIDAYLDEAGRYAGPLIRAYKGHAGLSAETVSNYVNGWIREAGVKTSGYDGRSAHGLRRTAASDVMDKVRDVQIVQAMLGHERIETTTLYLRPVNLGRLREAMEGRDYQNPSPTETVA